MSRDLLAAVVVCADMLICLFFIFFVDQALYLIEKEKRLNDKVSVQLTDFSVKIGNLPSKEVFGTHAALEAKLINHIINIIDHEECEKHFPNMT